MDAVWQEVRIAFNIQNDILSELFVQLNVSFSSLVLDYITPTVMAIFQFVLNSPIMICLEKSSIF